MKLAKYVADFIATISPRVYGVVGAGAMHLNDAICNHPDIEFVAMHHEQAAAMAAEADARVRNSIGVVHVTAGPGGTNAITGIAGAFVDSIPMLVIAGQTTTGTLKRDTGLRQFGTNELDVVEMVQGITKYAVTVGEPTQIRFVLERAVSEAMSGRRGPVLVEIPLDIQAAEIEPANLAGYTSLSKAPRAISNEYIVSAIDVLRKAERPLLLVGNGVHLAGAEDDLARFIDATGIPVVTSWNGIDLVDTSNDLVVGRPGVMGDRAGNFAVQNCDVLLCVGTRLSIPQTGHDQASFAAQACKIVVDIDNAELMKPACKGSAAILGDAGCFFRQMVDATDWGNGLDIKAWRKRCRDLKNLFPVIVEHQASGNELGATLGGVNSYIFVEELAKHLTRDAIVVTDVGAAYLSTMQSLKVRRGQRLMHSGGVSSMGWGLPAAIGAAKAASGRQVICLVGDGGIMMNLQELATIEQHNLPVKIFVMVNNGYLTMQYTQNTHFKREAASSPKSGVGIPQMRHVASAFGINGWVIASRAKLEATLPGLLEKDGPLLCEIIMPKDQVLAPRVQSKVENGKFVPVPFEDMWPYLPRNDFEWAMGRTPSLEPAE